MKKILAIICALALILTMASCGGTDRSGTSVTGKVTGIDGTKITLSLGEISESEQGGGQGGTPPEMPSGDNYSEQNGQPPELPSDASGSGEQGGTPPEMPSTDNSSEQNGNPPEKPDNDANGTQNAAPQGGQGGNIVFTESGAVWNLTGDCTLTSLTNNGTINFNGHTVTLADGTVLSA